ncbi:multidrug resistance-associated [Fusarium acutatum]|uniref:Multidrug resistance-associated n=1 Tax=Fusarium acutatum TaxID=78861 RepID=A0A8H4JB53_9HYPO|nr:multidrug resistance-associated [Fusarium acutatum]
MAKVQVWQMRSRWLRPFGQNHVPDIPEKREVTAEQDAGFLSKLWFAWLSPLMTIGYRRHLERNDIWTVSDARLMDTLQPSLDTAFRKRVLARNRLPLLWALYEVFKFDFWLGAVSQFVVSTLQVMTPFTLRFLIEWVQHAYPDGHDTRGSKPVAVGIGAKAGGQTGSEGSSPYDDIPCRVDEKGWSNGRVMSLVSNDTARIEQALAAFHLSWLSLYQLILTVALLVYNLGWTALPGATTLIFGLAAVTYATRPLVASRNRINIVTDQRVTLTQEILQSIRFVKYFGWEGFFQSRLRNIRASETRALRIMHLIRCAVGTLAQFLPVLAIMITFIVYAVVNGSLDPAVVFSSLAMLYLLRVPTNWLPVSLSLAADAVQSIKRIEDFLLAEEVQAHTVPDVTLAPAVKLSNASFTWESPPSNEEGESPKDKENKNRLSRAMRRQRAGHEKKGIETSDTEVRPVRDSDVPFSLNDISLECQRGELVGIIGSVGSGKTSLLSALAGDMRQTGGILQFAADRAYCPQYAWIQNASVRDNVTFGKPFNQKIYSNVVHACALLPDFELLPHGDMTEIGERGVTLSGGQKQRINIARAIYSDAGIVILDDPLSAVDAHVGTHIFNEAICGLLKGKCRFLATHHLHLLSRLDRIIWMVDGHIEAIGTYEELMKSHPAFASLVAVGGHQQKEADSTEGEKGGSAGPENTTTKAEVLMQEEAKIVDSVPFSVYVSWLRASGSLWNGLAMVVGQLLFRASSILGGLWLSWWVDNKYGLTRGQNIGIYAGLSLAQCVLVFSSSLITCLVCIKSSQVMSNNALWQTLRAPMSFFDTTPLGRIIYRFTRDIDALDNNLVVAVQQLLINVAALLGSYVLIVAYFYYFAIALVFGATALWWCISYYRSSARELRRHQLILDGVVFARLNEALIGAACIRAYDRELQFVKLVHEAIDDMDSANFLTFASHNWLSVRLDNIGILLNLVTGILVVTNALPVALSISGLLLTYSMSMVGMMQVVVKYLIEVNNSMSNTERLFQYTNSLHQEAPLDGANVRLSWPEHGAIEYEAVQMRYRPGLPLVVDNFCLRIAGGERLGIVGRTGAGKSTILSTLFRLTEISGGRITIDGVDIGQIGLHRLRSALAIIPQDPTLFQGTIRSNLDPFNKHTDIELCHALRKAHLLPDSEKSFAVPEGDTQTSSVVDREDPDSGKPRETRVTLDTAVETEGLNFSLGQRQLIALARALLRNTRIVLVDEGTSSVDPETDALVQETLATGLEGKTLIAIAHRLRTVIQYDRVCVMDKGKIVELGPPLELWEQGGIFRAMCDSNGVTREMFANV